MGRTKASITAAALAAAIAGLGATTASAGEITGTGVLKGVQGKSECAYSGLNDGPLLPPTHPEYEPGGPRVQTYGHTKAFLPPFLPKGLPGYACNPTGKRSPF